MKKRTVVVIGGTGGLGSAVVRAFQGRAWNVALSWLTAAPPATPGTGMLVFRADATRVEDLQRAADLIRDKWGSVDALVNCAGTLRDALLVRQSDRDWDTVLAVNLTAVFRAIRAFVPLMHKGGHVVNITSVSGLRGQRGQAAYSAAKAALIGLTKSAAGELAAQRILVNAVAPGFMPTTMGKSAPDAMTSAERESLLGRLSDPARVAEFILFLVTAGGVTGQVFYIDSRIV